MSELIKRTIFGTIYVALVVTSLLFFRPYYFQLLFMIVSTFAVREYYKITGSDFFLTLCGMLLSWLMFCASSLYSCTGFYVCAVCLFAAYGLLLLLSILAELFKKADDPLKNWGVLLSGQVMVALPFALMNVLFAYSNMLLLSLFIVIWLNDTGAYCTGKLIGKHKMFPRVSPGKSWEGLCGGALVAMVVGYILFADPFGFTNLSFEWWQSIILTLVIVVFGTLGDLLESLMKRTLGIKDSGNVIPGHGGLLDRFDSMLLATPAVVILLAITLICYNIFV